MGENHSGYGGHCHCLDGEVNRMRAALERLAEWDMLSLTPDGHGSATADAPWARRLIADALGDEVSGRE